MKMKKILTLLLLMLVCVAILGSVASSASQAYQTYTYSKDGFPLYSPNAYHPIEAYKPADLGAGGLNLPTDIYADPRGTVYIADSGNNRVVVLAANDYRYIREIKTFTNADGVSDSLSGCKGVFVDDEFIYVCDTNNYRIVVFDLSGNFVRIISKPSGTLFGTDTPYRPVAMAVDQYGRIFVISDLTYEGVIVMTNEGAFTGYIGAQKVSVSFFQMLWRTFQTAEQRKGQAITNPVQYSDLAIDSDGFIYATIGLTTNNSAQQQAAINSKAADYSPVKKLNSNGTEIMKRNGFFGPGGEVNVQNFSTEKDTPVGPSNIQPVAIGPEGTWSIADIKRSKIFTYDQNGVLLFAFGDRGVQAGNHQSIASIVYQGDKLLVLDSQAQSFTAYRRVEYGDLLIAALRCENERRFGDAIDAWLDVLQYNNNFDSAYVGVGQAYYNQGDSYFVSEDGQIYYKESDVAVRDESGAIIGYERNGKTLEVDEKYTKRGFDLSMEYLSAAYDDQNWSNAYKEIRKEWIADWILLIPLAAIAIIVGLSFLLRFSAKYNAKVALLGVGRKTYAQELMYVFHLIFHPFDGFWDLKHEKRGSVRASLTILALVVLAFYYQSIGTGYVMNPTGKYSSLGAQAISVLLPFILWVISNWCLTTLFDGEGSFKDVFIATSYALAPMPVLLVVSTILSNVVTYEESAIVSMITVVGFVWAGMLIFLGMMVTHDYSFTKNIIMLLVTIVGMAVIIFIGFLFSSLVGKMISFISSIITELSYRAS